MSIDIDRAMFAACLAIFRASGWWSEDDLAGYKSLVGQIMKGVDEDAKQAAREFWASQSSSNATGISQRIRGDLAQVERLAA